MFDFGLDKLLFVGVLVGIILGPSRLRELRRTVPRAVGRLHALYLEGRAQVVEELDDLAPDWREYDPRALHPRRILRDLTEGATQEAMPSADRSTPAVSSSEPPEGGRDDAKSGDTTLHDGEGPEA